LYLVREDRRNVIDVYRFGELNWRTVRWWIQRRSSDKKNDRQKRFFKPISTENCYSNVSNANF